MSLDVVHNYRSIYSMLDFFSDIGGLLVVVAAPEVVGLAVVAPSTVVAQSHPDVSNPGFGVQFGNFSRSGLQQGS